MVNIVKIGGNVIDNPEKLAAFLSDFAKIKGPKILIHGGGKIATKIAKDLGIQTKMVEGRRITDEAMRDVVTMVYGGLVNKQIVAKLQANHCNAIGLTGADGKSILAQKRPVKTIDYGFVGDILEVNALFIKSLLDADIVPVFAPLTFDMNGDMLNTNADTQASAVATGLSSLLPTNLVYCFEKKGVLSDPENEDSVISELNPANYESFKNQGVIYEGMIPKLDNAFASLRNGVSQVTICHADELENALETRNAGTKITL
ncbi:MAG TPA: acetylglutamate kinase [Leadbetterella sp.]|nr:acetylglutamate kinase [Leadbetterella sp.]